MKFREEYGTGGCYFITRKKIYIPGASVVRHVGRTAAFSSLRARAHVLDNIFLTFFSHFFTLLPPQARFIVMEQSVFFNFFIIISLPGNYIKRIQYFRCRPDDNRWPTSFSLLARCRRFRNQCRRL